MRKIHVLATTAAVAALATATAGMPAATAAPKDRVTSTQHISRSGGDATDAVRAAKAEKSETLFGTDQKLVVTDALEDSTGATHVRLARTYDGLRVVGGDLVVHRNASGDFLGSSQTLEKALTLSTAPRVSKARALALLKTNKDKSGTPELVVDATAATPRLAWIVTRTGTQKDGTPSRLETYVDAKTGKTIRSEQRIQTIDGDGQSLYGGTVPLNLTQTGSSYQLKDASRGGTYTVDVNNKTDAALLCPLLGIGCATGAILTSTDTHFGNGSTSSRESAAVDAQYGTDMTWDYYKATFGRDGIFGTGAGSFNRVHYGKNYVNAFWDGEKMTYGDGNGTTYGPLTSLDVAGHEMSHGVTENTAGLTYSGESGGLNEATSDIFGTMVEFYANNANDVGDYRIGEEIYVNESGELRRMWAQSADGYSFDCYPGAFSPTNQYHDPHFTSGVTNHFFYLLAEGTNPGGGLPASKTCNAGDTRIATGNGSLTGIGKAKAAAIWYDALTNRMTSNTSFPGARAATLASAAALYGNGSAEYNAVAAAWSAVKVN